MKTTIALIALASVSAALAGGRFGDPPNETHAWAVHDMHRPLPPKVEVPSSGVPSDVFTRTGDDLGKGAFVSQLNEIMEKKGWRPRW